MSIISFRHSAFLFLLFIVMYFYAVYVSDCLFHKMLIFSFLHHRVIEIHASDVCCSVLLVAVALLLSNYSLHLCYSDYPVVVFLIAVCQLWMDINKIQTLSEM